MADLIAEEREWVTALVRDVRKDLVDLTRESRETLLDRLDQILKQSDNRLFDRIEVKLDPRRRPDDDAEVPPSKH